MLKCTHGSAAVAAAIALSLAACEAESPTDNEYRPGAPDAGPLPGNLARSELPPASSAVLSQVIYTCVNNASGTIKVVVSGQACAQNESQLAWNTAGPPGPPGPPGPEGASGLSTVQAYWVQTSGQSGRVFCPAGSKVVGGGANSLDPGVGLIQNFPINGTGENATGTDIAGWQGATVNWAAPVQVFVLCASS